MSEALSPAERAYLESQPLGRLATVDAQGRPHIAPVGYTYNATTGTIDIDGFNMSSTAKFRHVRRSGVAALVVDDVLAPWRPRGIEIRGQAEALDTAADAETGLIRLHLDRIHSWGEGLHPAGPDGR
ncbi:MAG: PPOX class F420-dependent oxidoreductase [Acidimicrobiales bacterium]